MPNVTRIDLLIQYSILVAGEEDDFTDRSLGPIHLLKYVYLADYYYARRNGGETYTGIDWQFYNFGPWSQEVHSRIEPAMQAIMARKYTGDSDYGTGEFHRWSISDDDRLRTVSNDIPGAIKLRLKNDIHNHTKDTDSLLHSVYLTEPMLNAAPKELLDFSYAAESYFPPVQQKPNKELEKKNSKKNAKAHASIAALREKRAHKSFEPKLVPPIIEAKYDEVFDEGMRWLDSLAGDEFTDKTLEAKFSDEIWKSDTRRDGELP
ncbi:hypothetical protein [Saccharospirillum mangrovi]|uniref:hypothetical protein n=1 Tax=Saccharospirillum mangrovi TaxID=2161747 RepID=UPI000D38CDA5|nr:hypothetical protein [Saccharospirillum mangrovi]